MRKFSGRIGLGFAAVVAVTAATPAHAQDFFQALFGGFQAPRYQPRMPASR